VYILKRVVTYGSQYGETMWLATNDWGDRVWGDRNSAIHFDSRSEVEAEMLSLFVRTYIKYTVEEA